ncbi:MAG: UbiA prenyltransferase family protein [Candidatus Paceibacterales bacterium]
MKTNLKPYLRLFRIPDWRGYFLMASLGFVISKGFLFPFWDIIIFYAIVLLLLAFGFSVNDCFDTREDRYRKDRINPVVSKEISFRSGLFLLVLPGVLGLALSTVFGLKVFLFSLAGASIGFFYSAPPLRTKSRPLLDLVSHGLFAGVFLFVLPLLIFNPQLTLFHYLIAFSIFYLSMTLELRNHLEDYEVDKRAGLRTFVCVFGYKKSERLLRYLAILYPLTIFPIFLLISQKYLFLFLIFTLVFLFFFLFERSLKIVKNYRIMDAYAISSFGLLSTVMIF